MANTANNLIENVIESTNFSGLGEKYEGKVRDVYSKGDTMTIVVTDRLSCFDVVLTSVPHKGQILNQMAAHWFSKTGDIVENHIIDIPDPNVMLVKKCEVLPIEVVMRGYLAGSAWRDYEKGNPVSGIKLPEDLTEFAKLPETLITPSTKAQKGTHDEPISEEEILSAGIVEKKLWEQIREVSFNLFAYGQQEAAKNGLILVDTKYEFGLLDGKLIVVDEIHTADSSRYWKTETYESLVAGGGEPEMLDKEPARRWLISQGYMGDGEPPFIPDEIRLEFSNRYIEAYETITGNSFIPAPGNPIIRIADSLNLNSKNYNLETR